MTCEELTERIKKYRPFNEQEEADKVLILDWIGNNKNAFSRENISSNTGYTWAMPASSRTSRMATAKRSVSPSACPPSHDQELYIL